MQSISGGSNLRRKRARSIHGLYPRIKLLLLQNRVLSPSKWIKVLLFVIIILMLFVNMHQIDILNVIQNLWAQHLSAEQRVLIMRNKYMNGESLTYASQWISLVGYISLCDVHEDIAYSGIFDDGASIIHNREAFASIKNGDLVCLTADQLTQDFRINFLPLYESTSIKFIIFTWIRPRSFPSELLISVDSFETDIVANPHIVHVYCMDYDGTQWKNDASNAKVSGIPLGINFHSKIYKDYEQFGVPQHPQIQEHYFMEQREIQLDDKHYDERELKIFRDDMVNKRVSHFDWKKYEQFKDWSNAQHTITNTAKLFKTGDASVEFRLFRRAVSRWNALRKIDTELVHNQLDKLTQKQLFDMRGKYVFVLSPFGGGLDCYRTWEALIFGHIVITESSSLDELYDGLPVVLVNDWSEINEEKLQMWYNKYYNQTAKNNQYVREKLTTKYWIDYMKQTEI